MTDQKNLLPCPFCGEEPWGTFGPIEDGRFWIECCEHECGNWFIDAKDKDECRARWNSRKIETNLRRQRDELKLALEKIVLIREEDCEKYVAKADQIACEALAKLKESE